MGFKQSVALVAADFFGGEKSQDGGTTKATGANFTQAGKFQVDPSQETKSGETHA